MSNTGTSKLALSRASNPPYVKADGNPQKDFRPHNKELQWTHGDGAHCVREKSTMRAIAVRH